MEVRPSALNEVVIRVISHPIINETVITHCLLAGTCLSIKRPIMRTKFVAYLVPALGPWESAGGKSERKSAIILFLKGCPLFFWAGFILFRYSVCGAHTILEVREHDKTYDLTRTRTPNQPLYRITLGILEAR